MAIKSNFPLQAAEKGFCRKHTWNVKLVLLRAVIISMKMSLLSFQQYYIVRIMIQLVRRSKRKK